MLSSDWTIKVTAFFRRVGHESLEEIKCAEKNLEKHKEVEFGLPAAGLFRLIIESSGGFAGSLVVQNCEKIAIEHSEAKVKYKPRKFPKVK